ncbi:MAG TPA: hypothetical protein VHD36_17935 [Pirellulales bacterium]|nr:hypothetical protein [Pirellulales bacterium]
MNKWVEALSGRLTLVLLGLLVLSGCGTKAYEERVEKGLGGLRTAQMFIGISPNFADIPGTNIKLRLPKFVDGSARAYNDQSAEPSGQGPVNPGRLNPPYFKIPGLRVCYEMSGHDSTANQPATFYCYLAALPAADAVVDGKPVEEWIQAQLAPTFPGAQWESVQCATQSGRQVEWKMITVKGSQPFFNGTLPDSKNLPGVLQLFSKEIDGTQVLIGWRYPDNINQSVSDVARLTAGSAVGAAPADPPAAN